MTQSMESVSKIEVTLCDQIEHPMNLQSLYGYYYDPYTEIDQFCGSVYFPPAPVHTALLWNYFDFVRHIPPPPRHNSNLFAPHHRSDDQLAFLNEQGFEMKNGFIEETRIRLHRRARSVSKTAMQSGDF